MRIDNQITLADVDADYQAFADKFKPKKTTDDCYTPSNVYDAVLAWAVQEYGIDPYNVVRPFWPGGDFENYDYPEGCTVVDNPPFSIISKICKTYVAAGIRFFLFAPYLTNFSVKVDEVTNIITDASITYENGAVVNTAFLTNLDAEWKVRTAPALQDAITAADKENTRLNKKELPRYTYPPEVITATMMGYLSKYGIDFRIRKGECFFLRQLESQRGSGKAIFGGGFLISEKAAAEKAAAEKAAAEKAAAHVWKLSERERQIIETLGSGKTIHWQNDPKNRKEVKE